MIDDDAPLVYSTDPAFQKPVDPSRRKQRLSGRFNKPQRRHPEESFKTENINAFLRIEKSGRGGKTVTVVDRLPRAETFLKNLCRDLKASCGAGGKYGYGENGGFIEIQGDKRDVLRRMMLTKGIQCKG